jgi:hypothetical protein
MKKYLLLLMGGSLLPLNMALAQPVGVLPSMSPPEGYVLVKDTNSLPKFDLDFPGGTPKDLVKAVEKATEKPLNAVIPDDCRDLEIPAFSVKTITVAQLFQTLLLASQKSDHYMEHLLDGNISHTSHTSSYGFRTEGPLNKNSIWYFYWDKQPSAEQPIPHTVCNFYQLEPYLKAGYKVDDITTAVETAWKMLGITKLPQISYHKDTKVLIAVGDADNIKAIDDVLKQLPTVPKEKANDKDLLKSKDQ